MKLAKKNLYGPEPERKGYVHSHTHVFLILFLLSGLLILTHSSSTFAASYYLDPTSGDDENLGTPSEPWKTIDRACSMSSIADATVEGSADPLVVPGDTVILRSGDYGLWKWKNYDNSNWITYQAEVPLGPVFDQMILRNYTGAWDTYIIIDGVKLDWSELDADTIMSKWVSGKHALVYLDGIKHFKLKNSYIASNGTVGTVEVAENLITFAESSGYTNQYITIDNCELTGARQAINGGHIYNSEIKDCHIHDCAEDGLQLSDTYDLTISGCHIHDMAHPGERRLRKIPTVNTTGFNPEDTVMQASSGASGTVLCVVPRYDIGLSDIWLYNISGNFTTGNEVTSTGGGRVVPNEIDWYHQDLIQLWAHNENTIIQGNELHDSGQGIFLKDIYNGLIENNLVYGKFDNHVCTLHTNSQSCTIRNNTFAHNADSWDIRIYSNNASAEWQIYNNICTHEILFGEDWGSSAILRNNIVGRCTSGLGIDFDDTNYTYGHTPLTIAEKALLFADPSNINFHLKTSSRAIDFASPDNAPDTDMEGGGRVGPPDAGCYEYLTSQPGNQAPTADAGPDQNATDSNGDGSEQIILDGSGSTDPDGTIVSWVWTDDLEDTIPDDEVTMATLSVGEHTITLTVTDNDGSIDTDTISVTVNPADTTDPFIESVSTINQTTLEILFNEALDTSSAEDQSNYSISGGVSVLSASLNSGDTRVTLSTSSHIRGYYTLTITEIEDLAGNATNDSETYSYDDGLVGFWQFEEGSGTITADASGLGNTGTLINGPTWVSRNNDSALNFDGVDDYVDCGNDPSLNLTSNLTISAWINPRSFGQNGYGRIVDKGSSSTGFSFFLNEADNNLGYVIYGGTVVRSDAGVIALNQQQCVAVVYNGLSSTITFYIDGQEAGSSNYQTNPIDSSNDPLFIGIRGYDLNRDFDGLIDEVRIYNRALSADEIQELYSAGTTANNPPTAGNDSATVDEDSVANSVNVLANDTDADGDTPAITSVTQASHGSVAITGGGTGLTYTPTPDYNGPDSFTYTISDGRGGTDTATVSVTVTNTPDAPVLESIGNKSVDENTTLTFSINATDPDGDTLEYSVQQLPPGATFASPFVWTPDYDDAGTYEVIFVVSDGSFSDSETITITVNNINRSPVAVDDSVVTDEDNAVTTGNVLTNDSDADGQVLGLASATQPTHGTTVYNNDGTFTYTPAANYNGSDSFTYTVSDGNGGTATATVQIDITPINDPPNVSAIPDILQKYEDESILPAEIEIATDADSGDTLTYTYLPDLQSTNYILHVDVSDGTVTVGKDITVIVTPVLPTVVSVTVTKFSVEIQFSEELELSSAQNIANYTLSNNILVNAVALNTEHDKVTLYTSGHAEDTVYTLTVTGVKDSAGNSILESPVDYTYDSGLIGLWNFNTDGGNTALDASGYDNTATLINGPVWTEQGDLVFDGIDDAVEIPTSYWNVNSGTVALWAYAEDLAGTHYLFGHTTGSGSDRIQLYTLDQNLNLALGNSGELNIESLDSQTWHHFALTWDGTGYVVYVDGTEKASGLYTGLTTLGEFADIGNSGDASFDNTFAGHIDDARVYDRALTPDEIINVYLMSGESVRENKGLAFDVTATYPDGTDLTYSINHLPDGATFEDGTFNWRPWYDQAGPYDMTFLPNDQEQPQYSQTVTVEVEDVQLADWYQAWLEHLGLL